MRQFWTSPLLLCVAVLLGGCQRITDADKQAAIDCVKANVVAMEKQNMEAVMATIHPKSENYEPTKTVVAAIWKQYVLKFELEKVEIDRATTKGILVKFVQVVRKLEGPDDVDMEDSRTIGTHLLQKDGKTWKIWSTQVQSSQPIPEAPAAPAPAAATPKPAENPSTPAPTQSNP